MGTTGSARTQKLAWQAPNSSRSYSAVPVDSDHPTPGGRSYPDLHKIETSFRVWSEGDSSGSAKDEAVRLTLRRGEVGRDNAPVILSVAVEAMAGTVRRVRRRTTDRPRPDP